MEKSEKTKVSEQMRIYRATKRLSQAQLSPLVGVSQRLISFVETESWKNISEKTLAKIKERLEKVIEHDK